jgi:DNA-binding NarL/FixJ family response regulator
MTAYKSMASEYFPLKGRVLLVEDDALIAQWTIQQLKGKELEVVWVQDLESARKELASKGYHALLVDIFLTPTDKREGLQLVREVEEDGIPVIVISSHADLEIAKEALNHGACHLLEKPYKPEELFDVLNKVWLEPKGLGAAVDRFLDTYQLTPKEREITRFLLKGLSNKEIAQVTNTTEPTIKFYVSTIYEKCEVKSRTELFNSIFPT